MSERIEEIAAGFADVSQRIATAAVRVGRNPAEVKLVTVTKNFPVTDISALLSLGQRDVAENRVQEMLPKIEYFTASEAPLKWHLIGTLQRNKVRHIVGKVVLLHSVNTLELLQELEKRYAAASLELEILLQVNISGEDTKQGFAPENVSDAVELAQKLSHLKLRGLMTMAPFYEDPQEARPIFQEAARLLRSLREVYGLEEFDQLSMGMSNDYEIAVEEGATLVRVGSAILGARSYN